VASEGVVFLKQVSGNDLIGPNFLDERSSESLTDLASAAGDKDVFLRLKLQLISTLFFMQKLTGIGCL
jgi:hypothetical protein